MVFYRWMLLLNGNLVLLLKRKYIGKFGTATQKQLPLPIPSPLTSFPLLTNTLIPRLQGTQIRKDALILIILRLITTIYGAYHWHVAMVVQYPNSDWFSEVPFPIQPQIPPGPPKMLDEASFLLILVECLLSYLHAFSGG